MRAVGIKALKDRLSEYVRLAADGETVLVTDRDRVVAELVPPRPGASTSVSDAAYAELVRSGWLTPASRRTGQPPPRVPLLRWSALAAGLASDREDR